MTKSNVAAFAKAGAAVAALLWATQAAAQGVPPAVPPAAQVAHFTNLTFNSTFDKSLVDTAKKYPSAVGTGTQWYFSNYFGYKPVNASDWVFNADGSVTLTGKSNPNLKTLQFSTAAVAGKKGWVGTAFGCGGYFEADLKFDPAGMKYANGWPSFWGMAIEHLGGADPTWPGQPQGYLHFIETDFLEYALFERNPPNVYGGVLHEWYGIWKGRTCADRNATLCQYTSPYRRYAPEGTNWDSYNKIGFLWIPAVSATATTPATKGSATFFFNGKQMGEPVTWDRYDPNDKPQTPPPDGKGWAYGIIDSQHLAILLGTGISQPLTVKSVRVWQSKAACDVVH